MDTGCYARFATPAAAQANTMSVKDFNALAGTVYVMNTALWDVLGAPVLGANAPYGAAIGPPPVGGAQRRLPPQEVYFKWLNEIALGLSETHLLVGAWETALFHHAMMVTAAAPTLPAPPFPGRAAMPDGTVDGRFSSGDHGHVCLPYSVTHHGAALLTRRFRTAGSPSVAMYSAMPVADRARIVLAGIDLVREVSSAALDVLEASNATVDAINGHNDVPIERDAANYFTGDSQLPAAEGVPGVPEAAGAAENAKAFVTEVVSVHGAVIATEHEHKPWAEVMARLIVKRTGGRCHFDACALENYLVGPRERVANVFTSWAGRYGIEVLSWLTVGGVTIRVTGTWLDLTGILPTGTSVKNFDKLVRVTPGLRGGTFVHTDANIELWSDGPDRTGHNLACYLLSSLVDGQNAGTAQLTRRVTDFRVQRPGSDVPSDNIDVFKVYHESIGEIVSPGQFRTIRREDQKVAREEPYHAAQSGVETQIMLSVRLETEPLVSSGDESTVAAEVPTCAGILDVAETARVEPVATQAQEESEEWSDSANAPSAQLIDDLFADSRYSDDTLATLFGHEVLRLVQVQRAMLPSRETRAEAAEKDSKEAQADADFARHLQDEAETDLQNKLATKELVVELRESVQAYYDEVDAMTKSMEARIAENEASGSPKKAHELMTEDEHVKQSMIIYNKMVLVFNRLFHEEKQFFEMVNESNKEISENAQAAILLQCDPTEDLEIAARESGNLADLDEKCGTGLWDKLDLERQQFATDKDEVDTAAAPPTPVKLQDSSEVSEEASNEATSLRQDDLQNPAMLQVRDLDVARQIRRHGFPM
ncbi:unnamed protein product [Symbiodinium microadriaticum]|nr:unnamed protein product [Symbiodinium microadriaticum]